MATYTGIPIFIHPPPSPYHRDLDSSTHIHSEGKQYSSLFRLNISTISPISIHRWSTCGIPSGISFGLSLYRNALHNSSNIGLDIPVVIPSFCAVIYFLLGARLHSEALAVNSNRVNNTIIPSSLYNSGLFISILRLRFNWMFVIRWVNIVCSSGKEHKK